MNKVEMRGPRLASNREPFACFYSAGNKQEKEQEDSTVFYKPQGTDYKRRHLARLPLIVAEGER